LKTLRFKQFTPAIAYLAFTFFLFTLPGQELPDLSWAAKINFDKFVHLGLFTVLVFAFSYPFKKSFYNNPQRNKWFLYITLLSIAYGIAVEFIQKYFVTNRSCDVIDIAADIIGSTIGYITARLLLKSKK
jgi:general stress protein CsbA